MRNDGLNPIPPADQAGLASWLERLWRAVDALKKKVEAIEKRIDEQGGE